MAPGTLTDPTLSSLPLWQDCLRALRDGQAAQAEALAAALVRERPGAADAWHLFGVIALRAGSLDLAADRLARARALAPGAPAIRFDSAIVAGRRNDHAVALGYLDEVVGAWPDHAEAWFNRGQALRSLERHAEALASFERALALQPDLVEALHGRSHVLAALDRPEAALLAYDRVLLARPGHADALVGKGNVLITLDRPEDALSCLDRAIQLLSGHAPRAAGARVEPTMAAPPEPQAPRVRETLARAWQFRGDALRRLDRLDEAVTSHDQALRFVSDDADIWMGRGRVLLDVPDFHEALACYDRAVALRPDDPKPHDHRSRALRELGDYAAALAAAERALALKPGDAGGLNSRANALRMVGRIEEALADYAQAIALNGGFEPLRFNHAVCLLLAGDYARGWPEYEYRWSLENMGKRRPRFHQPLWLGRESVAGRRVLLWAEQGLGDTIQFCRYAPAVAALGATVILGVQPELRPLLSGMAGITDVVDRSEAPPVFDCHCPLLSLPLATGTTLASVPADVPYLAVPAGHRETWRQRLGAYPGPRIGLVWSGNRNHRNDHNRSIPLSRLEPLLARRPLWHCVQKDLRPEDVPAFAMAGNIVFHGNQLLDFTDTAALLSGLDLVITVDTAVAHLAGALGRPVWLLLPYAPDWRWMLHRDTTPWYPTMRLFRQSEVGDWDSVVSAVSAVLDGLIAPSGGTGTSGS